MQRVLLTLLAVTVLAALAGCGDDDCPACPKTGPILNVSVHKIDFGATGTAAVFSITNEGDKDLSWDITFDNADWLQLSAVSGTDDEVVTCTADRGQLAHIGVSRTTLIIECNGINTARDSIEVFIFKGGEWLITDGGDFDTCWVVDDYDYYWVKGFRLPDGLTAAFVDSVAFHFCEGDGAIQLLGFTAQWSSSQFFWYPGNLIFTSSVAYEVPSGWSTIPARFYISESPFFFGYLQVDATLPRPSIDTGAETDTIGSLRARDFAEDPDNPDLYWELDDAFQTLAIRLFISPVLEYNPKLSPDLMLDRYRTNLSESLARRGCYPRSIEPQLRLR
jgi:hypothetical protein